MFPTLFIPAGAAPLESFAFTAGQYLGTYAGYTGADPNNLLGAGAFGSFSDDSVTTYTVVAFYAYVYDGSGTPDPLLQTTVVLKITDGGAAPPSNIFDSITLTGESGLLTLLRSNADDPNGYDTGTEREWMWSGMSPTSIIATANSYTVEVAT